MLGAAIGRCTDAEQSLAADLLGCFGPGMLVLADRQFLSWSLARAALATGAHILWRASASFALRLVRALPDGMYLAELKPPRKSDGPAVTVRVIEYSVHTTAGDGAEETSEVSAWSPACSTPGRTRRWTWPAPIPCAGAARPSSATTKPTSAGASLCCAAAIPRASCRRCGHCSPSTRPSASSPGSPSARRASPGPDQLPARPAGRDQHRRGFPP